MSFSALSYGIWTLYLTSAKSILHAEPDLDRHGRGATASSPPPPAQVPYRLLRSHDALSVAAPADGNLLIEGDNLHALKALLPYYAGKVKCIYIDPPYNTGNEGWVYNDAVNAPEMKAWLADALARHPVKLDDLSRHDKWSCFGCRLQRISSTLISLCF